MFKKPLMFMSLVVMGSLIDLGTEPKAAKCRTISQSFTANSQVLISRISPSIKVKFGCFKASDKLEILPVKKLSKQMTVWSRAKSASHVLEPIKPAPPVTKICICVFIFLIWDLIDKKKLNYHIYTTKTLSRKITIQTVFIQHLFYKINLNKIFFKNK